MKPRSSILAFLLAGILLSSCSSPKFANLMTWEEYIELKLQGPYILELTYGEGALLYYGVMHTTMADDPQLADIERCWEAFRPSLAFAEGGDWPLEKSREEAIRRGGEQGPPHIHLVNKILRDLSQSTWGYRGRPRKLKQFEDYIRKYLPEVEDWRNITPSIFFSPDPDNFVSVMHRTLIHYRDEVMLGKIVKSLKKRERVFAIVGRAHVVMQEPALRTGLQ
jgi:hypothetical protein